MTKNDIKDQLGDLLKNSGFKLEEFVYNEEDYKVFYCQGCKCELDMETEFCNDCERAQAEREWAEIEAENKWQYGGDCR